MGQEAGTAKRKNASAPPDGYVCKLCDVAGHWIQQCPERRQSGRKRRKKSSDHVPVPGVDPSAADIDAAREMQRIPPPNCRCGERSRLKKVKKSKVDEKSRANGTYFFFCAKPREESCGFARPAEDERRRKGGKGGRAQKKAGGYVGDCLSAVASAENKDGEEMKSLTTKKSSERNSGNKAGKKEKGSIDSKNEGRDCNESKSSEISEKAGQANHLSSDSSSSSSEDNSDFSESSSDSDIMKEGSATKESRVKGKEGSSDSNSESDFDSDNSGSSTDSDEVDDQVF